MADKKPNSTVVLVVSFLLAVLFGWMGYTLLSSDQWVTDFQRWGYPGWLAPVIGALEIAAAVSLFVRRVAWIGAAGLATVMVGAIVTTIRHEGVSYALMPALLLTSL